MDNDLISLTQYHDVLLQLGDNEPSSRLEAKAVLEKIRVGKGYLDPEMETDLKKLKHKTQEAIHRIIQNAREGEADYTKRVAEDLYSTKYRFLYELVQNADDSSYRQITAVGGSPFLRFIVTRNELIVETNEDGFTRADINAICATGKSSKKAAEIDNHIGEKGLGFKSVFAIAQEVRIQSGLWSFYFQHRKGEDGLGMVTPIDCPSEGLPGDVKTRMRLRYSEETRDNYDSLVDAVKELPDTLIMFLQRLRNIHVEVQSAGEDFEKITIRRKNKPSKNETIIYKTQRIGEETKKETRTFLKHSSIKSNMPLEERRKNRKEVQITLAFPVDAETSQPCLSEFGQHVFAFLPLQRLASIQFLIQADFICSTNRQSTTDCPWNSAICQGVAEAFAHVVDDTFCRSGHPLKYSWLEYLPGRTLDDTWKSLLPSIIELLKRRPILQSWEKRRWALPEQLSIVSPHMIHDGKPLLPDLHDEIYLAPEYSHHSRLRELGVHGISRDQVVDRLQADLARVTSRTKTTEARDIWHETFATCFSRILSQPESNTARQRLLKLDTIPLIKPNQWTGAPGVSPGGSRRVFFAFHGISLIPPNLGLRLLDKTASRNIKRKSFYAALGVEECSRAFIFEKIKKAHESVLGPGDPRRHFLYLFQQQYKPAELNDWIWAPTMDAVAQRASKVPLYFPSDSEFDTYQLIPLTTRHAKFLPKVFSDREDTTIRQDRYSWKQWLQEVTGARYFPPLYEPLESEETNTLSAVLKIVLEKDPMKFLAVLRAHWSSYAQHAHLVVDELQNCIVPCGAFSREFPLLDTYFPNQSILQAAAEMDVDEDELPILSLPGDLKDNAVSQSWRFLTTDCSVRSEPDLDLYLMILSYMAEQEAQPDHDQVAQVYTYMTRLARTDDHAMLQESFYAEDIIWDPKSSSWVDRTECIWDAPDFITHKTVLKESYNDHAHMQTFFTTILGLRNWTLDDIFEELEHRQDFPGIFMSTDRLVEIYGFLDLRIVDEEDWKTIRTRFSDEQHVLGADKSWYKLKKCVWSSAFALSGYQDLSTIYPTLERFFVRRLHVKKATPSMLVKEIKRMAAASSPNINDIHSRLVEVGMMLSKTEIDDSTAQALESLRKEKFLPKYTDEETRTLAGVDDAFAIPDHPRYSEAFEQHGVLLAFSLDEVQILDVIFRQLKLTHRYLSKNVEEVSAVGKDAAKNESLSQKLQLRAYALFCCAAKHKSKRALRDDDRLFELLSEVEVYTTNSISTELVLDLGRESIRAPSTRALIHHHTSDRVLKIYMPSDAKQQRSSYRSQLPKLLSRIVCRDERAALDISSIIKCNIMDLDDVLMEQDIPDVAWIEKPTINLTSVREETPDIPLTIPIPFAAHERRDSRLEPDTPIRNGSVFSETVASEVNFTPAASEYADLVDQVVRSAQRANNRRRPDIPVANTPPHERAHQWFDHERTFGMRERDQFAHDRRVGAPGEAYVFEVLSGLDLPNFSQANWQSTIRGVLSGSTRFANIQNWVGRETADIVYKDHTGALTTWLRENCTGGFPNQISIDHDHSQDPIEYYLEVKTTTSECSTRFYMSNKQYERMGDMHLHAGQITRKVYVIMRVYDLLKRDVGLKVFVDPARFDGTWLHFEAERWFVNTVEQGD